MQVNHGQMIYPQNLIKYTGSIYQVRSNAKNGNNKIVSFRLFIKSVNFKYQKNFLSRQEAESELIRLNHENKLDIKNTILDQGDHYLVRLHDCKNFLADKIDLPFIEAYIWYSINNYVYCKQNGRYISFPNLVLDHILTDELTVDHINRNSLDNRRSNLRIATRQTQMINQNPRLMAIQPGVTSDKTKWISTWLDEKGIRKTATFSINKYGYEVAKQLAIAKRLEIELSLNHYRLALHNLPPLKPEEPEVDYDFEEQDEPDEI